MFRRSCKGWIAFTLVARLDKKNRIVVPVRARQALGITDSVKIMVWKDRVILLKPGREKGLPVSKNVFELDGRDSVAVSTRDCGSLSPGSKPRRGKPSAFSSCGENPGRGPITRFGRGAIE